MFSQDFMLWLSVFYQIAGVVSAVVMVIQLIMSIKRK